MASIVIRDLPDSVELDRQAMQAISGGARTRGSAAIQPGRTIFRDATIIGGIAGIPPRQTATRAASK